MVVGQVARAFEFITGHVADRSRMAASLAQAARRSRCFDGMADAGLLWSCGSSFAARWKPEGGDLERVAGIEPA